MLRALWRGNKYNFIVFDFTRPGSNPRSTGARGELANHYTTDAVMYWHSLSLTNDLQQNKESVTVTQAWFAVEQPLYTSI